MNIPPSYHLAKQPVAVGDLWNDPDPNPAMGLLLSDRIQFYCQRVNLVYPFDEAFLEAASYTLHAGREYVRSVSPGELEFGDLEKEGKVVIPPNGLIYIRFYEEVNLPHYLIARFNLRVRQVYRGLLLGTGPQVDPGFQGYLGCPIHNFTDGAKSIEFFEDLITIDFEKTTPLGRPVQLAVNDSDFAAMQNGVTPVLGVNGLRCKIWNKGTNRNLRWYLPPGESIRSSVHALNDLVHSLDRRVDEQTATIRLYRRIAITAFLTILGGVIWSGVQLYANVKDDVSNRYMNVKNDVTELSKAIGRLEAGLSSLSPNRTGQSRPVAAPSQGSSGEVEASPGKPK